MLTKQIWNLQMFDSSKEGLDARRDFLKACAKYAAVTPPVMTLLLSPGQAMAGSGNNGFGNGGSDGSPNGKSDIFR